MLINSDEGGKPLSPCADPEIEYSGLAAVVLEQEDCPIGAVALMCTDKTRRLGDLEVTILKIAKELLCSCCTE